MKTFESGYATNLLKLVNDNSNMVCITYANLKSLANTGNLVPGRLYRIIDYVTTVNSSYTISGGVKSAGFPFNIIVIAATLHELLDVAFASNPAASREDKTFRNPTAWILKYSLNVNRYLYPWADPNGTGVIYYMKDDAGNECQYDFKNIMFPRYKITLCDKTVLKGHYMHKDDNYIDLTDIIGNLKVNSVPEYFFTFSYDGESGIEDYSEINEEFCNNNSITKSTINNFLPNTVFVTSYKSTEMCLNNLLGTYIENNTFSGGVYYSNSFNGEDFTNNLFIYDTCGNSMSSGDGYISNNCMISVLGNSLFNVNNSLLENVYRNNLLDILYSHLQSMWNNEIMHINESEIIQSENSVIKNLKMAIVDSITYSTIEFGIIDADLGSQYTYIEETPFSGNYKKFINYRVFNDNDQPGFEFLSPYEEVITKILVNGDEVVSNENLKANVLTPILLPLVTASDYLCEIIFKNSGRLLFSVCF